MSEQELIQAAIETLEGYVKAVEQRISSGDCGVAVGYDAMVDRRANLKYAILVLRAQQERENPQPLTCVGCKSEIDAYSKQCRLCIRANNYSDHYEPKGEQHG